MPIEDPIIGQDGAPVAVAAKRPQALKVGLAVLGAIVVVGGFLAWRFASGFGSATDAASAVPSDADVYVNVDMASFIDGELLDRLGRTFPDAFEEIGDGASALDELDAEMQRQYGLTVSGDVIPWLGRSTGIAMWDFDVTSSEPGAVLAVVKTRDGGATDRFLERLAGVAGGGTVGFHEGFAIWELDIEGETTVAARVDDVLLLAESRDPIKVGIDTKIGLSDSIQQNVRYIDALAELPDGPGMFTVYASGSLWNDIYDEALDAGVDPALEDLGRVESGIASMDVTDDGFRIDGIAHMDPELAAFYANDRLRDTIDSIPIDALFHVAADYGPAMDLYRDVLEDDPSLDREAIETEFGFDPISDGLDLLDGSFSAYAVPGSGAADMEFPFGFAAALGVTDPSRMQDTVDQLVAIAEENGMPAVSAGGFTYVEVFDNEPIAVGLDGDELVVAWNTDPAADRSGPSVTESTGYQHVAGALGTDTLAMYVDIAGLVTEFGQDLEPDDRAVADVFRELGVAWSASEDGVVSGSLLLTIDWTD